MLNPKQQRQACNQLMVLLGMWPCKILWKNCVMKLVAHRRPLLLRLATTPEEKTVANRSTTGWPSDYWQSPAAPLATVCYDCLVANRSKTSGWPTNFFRQSPAAQTRKIVFEAVAPVFVFIHCHHCPVLCPCCLSCQTNRAMQTTRWHT